MDRYINSDKNLAEVLISQLEWHQYLGLIFKDYFYGTRFVVDLEVDLTNLQEIIDIIILRQETGDEPEELPDGLENLGKYNLVTFKALGDTLSEWVLDELLGYYVRYRKKISPSLKKLVPREDFRLYAICVHKPGLVKNAVEIKKDAVYDIKWGSFTVRIIIAGRIAGEKKNAIWEFFSGNMEKVKDGIKNYHAHTAKFWSMMRDLIKKYNLEGLAMSATAEQLMEQCEKNVLASMSIERRLAGLSPDDRLHGLSPDDRLHGLSPENIEAYLKKIRQKSANDGRSGERI